jgi:hypothetical protein
VSKQWLYNIMSKNSGHAESKFRTTPVICTQVLGGSHQNKAGATPELISGLFAYSIIGASVTETVFILKVILVAGFAAGLSAQPISSLFSDKRNHQ